MKQQQQQQKQLAQSTIVATADDEDWESTSGVGTICSICNEAETFGSEGVCCECDWKRDPRYQSPAAPTPQTSTAKAAPATSVAPTIKAAPLRMRQQKQLATPRGSVAATAAVDLPRGSAATTAATSAATSARPYHRLSKQHQQQQQLKQTPKGRSKPKLQPGSKPKGQPPKEQRPTGSQRPAEPKGPPPRRPTPTGPRPPDAPPPTWMLAGVLNQRRSSDATQDQCMAL